MTLDLFSSKLVHDTFNTATFTSISHFLDFFCSPVKGRYGQAGCNAYFGLLIGDHLVCARSTRESHDVAVVLFWTFLL